ncbi:hypothetical protein ACO34A_00465 [Rhizobium sp. ACO-34A]|nr:branched-chain amino acid ABC transporter permease [Rhizobium sp. ACO-34A]ATN32288.1 hypothetical protein ACO34A_00465 [Rhizobium sp. ACO-34A]
MLRAALLVATCLFLLTLPAWGSPFAQRSVAEFLYLLTLALAWNVLAGYAGLVSIGQQAFVGVGAYSLVVLAEDIGINPFLTIPLAAVVAGIVALPASWILFRLRGAYFAVATWVIAEVLRLGASASIDWLGGGRGRAVRSLMPLERGLREDLTYYAAFALAGVTLFAAVWLLRSGTGLGLMALRDSEGGAESIGVETRRTKRTVYIFAAAVAGAAGALIYIMQVNVRPDAAFSINWAAYVIFIVVIGGIGTIEGPIIGTLAFLALRGTLSGLESWSMLIFGAIAVVVMLFAPRGIWGLVTDRWPVALFPIQRRMPSRFTQKEHPA